jgi:small subunit ribosomal protein S23
MFALSNCTVVFIPPPNSAIRFAVNLHEYHKVPITHAYEAAVAQFRALRSEHEVSSRIALMEAEQYGIKFGPTMTEKMFEEEQKALRSWSKNKQADAMENTARKRWRMIPEKVGEQGSWTKGEEYTRLWQQGVRPSYAPMLASKVITDAGLETAKPTPPSVAAPSSPPPQPAGNKRQGLGRNVPLTSIMATIPQ